MKILTVASIMALSFAASANSSLEKINAEIVDKVIDTYTTAASKDILSALPKVVGCTDYLTLTETDFSKARVNDRGQTLLVDWSDGDQVSGIIFLIADLKDLAAKKVESISAQRYGGFWYIDGDHYAFQDTGSTCKLK